MSSFNSESRSMSPYRSFKSLATWSAGSDHVGPLSFHINWSYRLGNCRHRSTKHKLSLFQFISIVPVGPVIIWLRSASNPLIYHSLLDSAVDYQRIPSFGIAVSYLQNVTHKYISPEVVNGSSDNRGMVTNVPLLKTDNFHDKSFEANYLGSIN